MGYWLFWGMVATWTLGVHGRRGGGVCRGSPGVWGGGSEQVTRGEFWGSHLPSDSRRERWRRFFWELLGGEQGTQGREGEGWREDNKRFVSTQ